MNTESQNSREVGVTPDDNNNIRLPNTLQPEPTFGAGEYNFAKSTGLDPKGTAGIVGVPSMGEGYGMPAMNSNVDITNSDTTLNTTNSEENLSAKYKYPNVSQDVPEKGRGQYADHS